MATTKLDPIQMQRASFDEQQNAFKVALAPTEIGVELSHEDGDSVFSHKKMQVIQCEANQIIDTSLIQTICSPTAVSLKAVVLNEEFAMSALSPLIPKEICVPAIKVMQACKLILRG